MLLLLNFEMWWNDNLKLTIIRHQVLYSGVSGGNKRRSTCTQTSTGETWWDKPMSFIFLVSCQPFWFYKAIILIVISWMVPWMTFLALMTLFSGLVWSWDRICSTRRGYRVPQTSWGKIFVIIPSSSISPSFSNFSTPSSLSLPCLQWMNPIMLNYCYFAFCKYVEISKVLLILPLHCGKAPWPRTNHN